MLQLLRSWCCGSNVLLLRLYGPHQWLKYGSCAKCNDWYLPCLNEVRQSHVFVVRFHPGMSASAEYSDMYEYEVSIYYGEDLTTADFFFTYLFILFFELLMAI